MENDDNFRVYESTKSFSKFKVNNFLGNATINVTGECACNKSVIDIVAKLQGKEFYSVCKEIKRLSNNF